MQPNLPIIISCGDPAGIGLELIFKAWLQRTEKKLPPFICLADPEYTNKQKKILNFNIPVASINTPLEFKIFDNYLPIIPLKNKITGELAKPNTENASAIIESISRSVEYIAKNQARALVTCPISKNNLYQSGFTFPGHTEFLAALAKKFFNQDATPVMMLAGETLKTVPITIHIPLSEVAERLSKEVIIDTATIVHNELVNKFKITSPRIVITGINPHAGEAGTIGSEEETIIIPAINYLKQNKNINILGPFPADTLFHSEARQKYDVALCIYHDQALIPIKTLHFHDAVNITLGLPFVRTSPDHGTAFDIATKNIANADSLIEAIKTADKLTKAF
ncbi:4-hydroxythreonine-4-phosphate dehydrogenase PdxA [Bartonella sp. DGB1]|uniref:4-hydroxythreonine-4-phosphate dehydrogenase PdxA n=1 Tax=Bartonella sp. DGB1 TaxID=3239807 RepID=UPI0035267FAC